MAINVQHSPDAVILGKAAEATGAAGAFLDNRRATLEAKQRAGLQASSIAAQQDNLATQLGYQAQHQAAAQSFDAQQAAAARAAEDAWRKRVTESTVQSQREHDQAVAKVEEKKHRAEFVQNALKDGIAFYDPASMEAANNLQASIARTMRDNTLAPDVKQTMLAQQYEALDEIVMHPSVRINPPKQFHETVEAGSAFLDSETGKPAPMGSRPLKRGDYLIQPSRDGFRYVPFDDGSTTTPAKPTTLFEARSQPDVQQKLLTDALRRASESMATDRQHAIDVAQAEFDIAKAELEVVKLDFNSKPEVLKAAETRFKDSVTSLRDAKNARPSMPSYHDAMRIIAEDEAALRGETPRQSGGWSLPQGGGAGGQQQGQPGSSEQNPIPIASEAEADRFNEGTWVILNGRRARVRKEHAAQQPEPYQPGTQPDPSKTYAITAPDGKRYEAKWDGSRMNAIREIQSGGERQYQPQRKPAPIRLGSMNDLNSAAPGLYIVGDDAFEVTAESGAH